MKYLFVCTGNTCRSPLAESIFRKRIDCEGKKHKVSSRGIMAAEGMPPSENAVAAGSQLGVDLSNFLSHPLSEEDVTNADVILTMTQYHKDTLLALYPGSFNKTFTLAEYVSDNIDIIDPFGGDIATYKACALELKRLIDLIKI